MIMLVLIIKNSISISFIANLKYNLIIILPEILKTECVHNIEIEKISQSLLYCIDYLESKG